MYFMCYFSNLEHIAYYKAKHNESEHSQNKLAHVDSK